MNKTWIKICGLTRHEDAQSAVDLGADAIGLVFYPPSPRAVEPCQIKSLVNGLIEKVTTVGLFVNPSVAEVEAVLATNMISLLQFHGDESAEYCASFGVPYMKALRVAPETDLREEFQRFNSAQLILLDSFDKKAPGGTGKQFDWAKTNTLSDEQKSRVVLAGGLSPNNIVVAMNSVAPFGVDVSSGVESSPGIKNQNLVASFIEGVRNVSS